MEFLLDSVILIDHLNNMIQATEWIDQFHEKSCISFITRAEILTGIPESAVKEIKLFLDGFINLPLHAHDADLAAILRRKYRWKLPDAIQAALAINHNLILVTRNTKDFSPKQHDFVQIPYK